MSFAVIDFETTGLMPERSDRAIEVGVVLTDDHGQIEHEWSTLINPLRDVGASHIHGLRASDLLDAPQFPDISEHLLELVRGRALVAHNASFDMRFLHREFVLAGYPVADRPPALCSMKWAGRLVGPAKLQHCCEALGINLVDAHSALADARATSELLQHLLHLGAPEQEWRHDVDHARNASWPMAIPRLSTRPALARGTSAVDPHDWLDTILSAAWIPGAPEDEASYLLVLDRAILDRSISRSEGEQLAATAQAAGLTPATVERLHLDYLRSVAQEAWADHVVTDEEHADLLSVAEALRLSDGDVDDALKWAEEHTTPQAPAVAGFTLEAGDRIVFTGELSLDRDQWVSRIVQAGLTTGGVSKSTKVVVTADPDSMSGKAVKARRYGIPIIHEDAFVRLLDRHMNGASARTEVEPLVHTTPESAVRIAVASGPAVRATAATVISHAMAHNHIPVVTQIIATGLGATAEVVVAVAITDRDTLLTQPFRISATPAEDQTLRLGDLQVRLDPTAMAAVEERRPGRLHVSITDTSGQFIAEHVAEVTVLPSRHWLRMPEHEHVSYEILAAHVMPNDPALTPVIAAARERLRTTTGSASTQGYQSGPERADEIVGAIYEEFRSRGINYSNPPASWDTVGQKIRTPRDILTGKASTCLDSTLLLAAALEDVGINPLVFIVEGHAFLGYFREEFSSSAVATTDLSGARNAIDTGLIRLIETNGLTEPAADAAFTATQFHRKPFLNYLSDDLSRAYAVVDVVTGRRNGIVPLPAIAYEHGTTTVVEYVRQRHSGAFRPVDSTGTREATPSGPAAPPRVQQWKHALLDLSLRNRLINFSPRLAVALAVPDGGLPHVEDRLNAGKRVALVPADRVGHVDQARGVRLGSDLPQDALAELFDADNALFCDLTEQTYTTRLRNLAAKARTITEETGANNLYIALGSLHWTLDQRELQSPLILIPIQLIATRTGYRIVLDEAGSSTPNYCLIEKLRLTDGLRIPGFENPEEDGHGVDLAAVFTAIRTAVAEHGLPYHVEESADIAILQFAKYRLWRDLDESWEQLAQAPLVRHLIETPTDPFADPVDDSAPGQEALDDLDATCPIPADSSQLEAIAAAVAGNTFVLEGPPGTGKSQTITNLLARAVASGKKVLFVAEKRAALDVVSRRLDSIGIGPFALDLHDKNAGPTLVRRQIKEALDHQVGVDQQGLDADRESRRGARRALARYADRLHETNNAGLSFYSARTQQLALEDVPAPLDVDPNWVATATPETITQVTDLLARIADVADPARPRKHHPWGFLRHPLPNQTTTHDVIAAVTSFTNALAVVGASAYLAPYVAAARNLTDLQTIGKFVLAPPVALGDLDAARTRSWNDQVVAYSSLVDQFVATPQPGLDRVDPRALDLALTAVRSAVEQARSSGFFGRSKRTIEAFAPVAGHLLPDAKVKSKAMLALVDELLATREAADRLAPGSQQIPGLRTPADWNPFLSGSRDHLTTQTAWISWASQFVAGDDTFAHATRTFVAADVPLDPASTSSSETLGAAARELSALSERLDVDIASWLGDARLVSVWGHGVEERQRDPERALTRWLAFVEQVTHLRGVGLTAAADQLLDGQIPATDAVRAFQLGLALASTAERRAETGMDGFDAEAHLKAVERFTTSMSSIREHLTSAVPHEILSARPFQASTGRGKVGALQRELNKQRGGMKVRELLNEYGDLITEIMPCVLVSPDSVARFFPVGSQTFDLVVFDEASQIRVADAVGALGRAKAAVVVGDSRQMPPTSVAESTFGTDDTTDEFVVADEESILTEAVQARVKQRWLTWHYRSRNEALIAFSNQHYYDNKLASFPAPTPADHADSGIHLVRVNGTFVRERGRQLRTNPLEAQAIIEHIRGRFAASPDTLPSLGVVTFNLQQRELIEGMLRDLNDERIINALEMQDGEGLFVKNLENVQGDERDVILFSTGFSKNESGKLPLNFGPLNNAGGERRLNVAVTRARTQVIIFSSFDPSDLRAEETSSLGVKHLRAYLDLAAEGPSVLGGHATHGSVVDRHRDEIADALRARGLQVRTDLGLSTFKVDLAILDSRDQQTPAVAVLLDGPGWASRRTTGDRDGLPTSVLEGLMNWPRVERVWLPEWLTNSEAVADHLVATATSVADRTVSMAAPRLLEPAPTPSTPAPVTAVTTATAEPDHAQFTPWVVQVVGERSWLDALPSTEAKQIVWNQMTAILEAESPIADERLARLSAAAFDLTRLNKNRIISIVGAVPPQNRDEHGFVWRTGALHESWPEILTAPPETPRPMTEIHPRELVAALAMIVRSAWEIGSDELFTEVLRLYGWKRRTEATLAPVQRALSLAVQWGALTVDENGVVRVGPNPPGR